MGMVIDDGFASLVQDGEATGFDDEFIVAGVRGGGEDALRVNGLEGGLAGFEVEALESVDRVEDVVDAADSVADGDEAGAAEVVVLEIVGAGFGVEGGSGGGGLGRQRVGEAAVLVGMVKHGAGGAGAVEGHALGVGAGGFVGIAERRLDVEDGAVGPADAGIAPEVAFAAVGIGVDDAVVGDGDGEEAGDEMDEIDVVAADVGERVGVLGGTPVLEVRFAVIPLFHEAGGAEFEVAEAAVAVEGAGFVGAVVEALVIFNGDKEAAGVGGLGDGFGLGGGEDQGLDAEDVLVGLESRHDGFVVDLVGEGDEDGRVGREGFEQLLIEMGLGAFGFGVGVEGLAGEGLEDGGGGGEVRDGFLVLGADGDGAEAALALAVVEGGEELIVGDHASSDDEDVG